MKPHPPGAVASLVFGILALIAWFVPMLEVIIKALAIASSRRTTASLTTMPETYQSGGLPTAGLVTGIIGLVLSSLVMVWAVMMVGMIGVLAATVTG
ncbi:MAG TPA: hypothetical protein VHX44_03770 [Planctomycetota bacterium]|nr:hypothetical protein [Planctomycetota bacterium]